MIHSISPLIFIDMPYNGIHHAVLVFLNIYFFKVFVEGEELGK